MNSPQVLALFLSAGLLLALHSNLKIRFLASPLIALALALTMARTAWVSFMCGLTYLVIRGSARLRLQIVVAAAIAAVSFGIALQDPEVAAQVSQRFNTLNDVSHDDSFVSRLEGHEALLAFIGENPLGFGLGGQASGRATANKEETVKTPPNIVMQNDSSLAAVILSLGVAGSMLAAASFLLVASTVIRLRSSPTGAIKALKMLALVLLAETFFDNIVNGPAGFLTWAVLGFCLAANESGISKGLAAIPRRVSQKASLA
jgi:hypothetical protein